jgi:uncharacterized protein YcgI (DUF1989 family)
LPSERRILRREGVMNRNNLSNPLTRFHLDPQTGVAFTVQQGQIMRIIDVEGEQVSDLIAFAHQDFERPTHVTGYEEYLSSGRTIDYNRKLFFSVGDILYSNRSNAMLSITRDRVERHVFLYAPCSQEMFRLTYQVEGEHPNCLDNLAQALGEFGIKASQIPTAFNVFMNVSVLERGELAIEPPLSRAGDYIELRAEMDLIVGVTACSAGKCNNYRCTSIEVEVYE